MDSLLARRSLSLVAVSCWIAFSFGCDSDDPPKDDDGPSGGGTKVTALRGTVTRAGGGPLADVKVSAGSVTATTDASGRYELKAGAGKTRVSFELDGYVGGFRSPTLLNGSPTQLDIALLKLAEPMPFDASSGGRAMGARGAAVQAPAGAFVDGTGAVVSGMVDLYLTPLDVGSEAERAAAPEFVTERDGSPELLESMGMLDIQVRKGDEQLSVASGKALELSIPVPADAEPQATMDLWSFDEEKSLWVHEGEATYDEATRTYVGSAKHMSLWNVDQVYTATCVCGVVREEGEEPLPGARIEANGVSYFGTTAAQSDGEGKFCIAVRKDSEVDIAAYHASGGGQSRRVESGSNDTMVPPRVGASGCLDAGTWTVKKDVFTGSSGEMTSCGDVGNPFEDSCAADLGRVFGGCYNPMGECTIAFSGGTTVIKYENGSRSEGGLTDNKFYSSDGKLCATSTYDLTSDESISITYMIPNKGNFTMTVGAGGTGDYVIKCPGGRETRITAEEQQALQACSAPGMTGGDMSQCKIEGTPSVDGGVGIPSSCEDNSDCESGTVCCEIPNGTINFCFDENTCNLIKDNS